MYTRKLVLRLGCGILAVALAAGIGNLIQHGRLLPAPPLDPASLHPGWGPKNFAEAMEQSNRAISSAEWRVSRQPGDWLPLESLARARNARYRLTGNYDDLAEADRLVERAMHLAPWPAGPVLSRSSIALGVHKLDTAAKALQQLDASVVPPGDGDRMEALSIRCEITFQRGDIPGATRICASGNGLSISLRLANIAAKSGHLEEAARRIEQLLERPNQTPSTLAALAQQRASVALAAGDWTTSGKWVRLANQVFPGHWLGEAFLAQQLALEGKHSEAIRLYRELAIRTGNPDIMDALSRLLAAEGRTDEAREWIARSTSIWQHRMNLLPEATATHFAEHLLDWGDPMQALTLARGEYRRRPFSTPATNYVRALLHVGQPAAALRVSGETLARGWSTASLWFEHSRALGAMHRPSEAAFALYRARLLNPRIGDPAQAFVSFDQD